MKNKITTRVIILSIIVIGGLYIYFSTRKQLSTPKNISQSVKDICKEKGRIECIGNCVDGFNEYCYFDLMRYKKDELKSGFFFPEETRQKCFAIHSFSVCGECFNKFELKKDNEFKNAKL